MKTFTQLRELTGRKPEGNPLVDKRVGRIKIKVHKERNGYVAYVDGDRLDSYRSKNEAEKAATEFVKAYKK
jgi:hypothetical protein